MHTTNGGCLFVNDIKKKNSMFFLTRIACIPSLSKYIIVFYGLKSTTLKTFWNVSVPIDRIARESKTLRTISVPLTTARGSMSFPYQQGKTNKYSKTSFDEATQRLGRVMRSYQYGLARYWISWNISVDHVWYFEYLYTKHLNWYTYTFIGSRCTNNPSSRLH